MRKTTRSAMQSRASIARFSFSARSSLPRDSTLWPRLASLPDSIGSGESIAPSSASSPAPSSTRQERRARSTLISAKTGSTMPFRTSCAAVSRRTDAAKTSRSPASAPPSRSAQPAPPHRIRRRAPASALILVSASESSERQPHGNTTSFPRQRIFDGSERLQPGRAVRASQASIMPDSCMASSAMRCAAPSPKPSLVCADRTSSAKAPPPGTTTIGRGLAAMTSSQAESSRERTTLPPSLTTARPGCGARPRRAASAGRAWAVIRSARAGARSRRRRRQAPCRASRS